MLHLCDRLLQQLARVQLVEQSMGIQLLGQFEVARLISNLKPNPKIELIYENEYKWSTYQAIECLRSQKRIELW